MSYYIINSDTGQIIDVSNTITEEEIQEHADYFKCPVYAISGEHSGFEATPNVMQYDYPAPPAKPLTT